MRQNNLRPARRVLTIITLIITMLVMRGQAAPESPKDAAKSSSLTITTNLQLDPTKVYGKLLIKASHIVIDGRGAWIVGDRAGRPKDYQGIAIEADQVSHVTLRNINVKRWETGLKVSNATGWTIENCDFSDNFHDPEFGWGEHGRRGGMVLDHVTKSTIRHNRANRVWDACALIDSDDNIIEDNDFSHTSNTCLKLWTACRNIVRKNILSYGIRISPGEVHARDSTSVLIESGSNGNQLIDNDCKHGGDGIFVRVLNNWCSTDNRFEDNDCSHANNNGIECWAPRNLFIRNKANYCSYGFWLGGSDQTRLIQNEASYNGTPDGHRNSPHLPENGHAGIVFMFGPSSHTVCRGNICNGNNGAGIAFIGDLGSQGQKWKAWHWILEENRLEANRWGLYGKHADWITAAGNIFRDNSIKDVQLDGDVTHFEQRTETPGESTGVPLVKLTGPAVVKVGETATWKATAASETGAMLVLKDSDITWGLAGGELRHGADFTMRFDQPGLSRIGLNVKSGMHTDLAWRDVYVIRDVHELGTEGKWGDWSVEDFHDRIRSNEQVSRARFVDTPVDALVGKSALQVEIQPYAGFRVALNYPAKRDANWPSQGKQHLVFWLKAINEDVTGWQGGPFIVLHGEGGERCYIEPKPGLDLMRTLAHNEEREGWRLMQIPLAGDALWQVDGKIPQTVKGVSLAFDSWGAPRLRFWIDGLALE